MGACAAVIAVRTQPNMISTGSNTTVRTLNVHGSVREGGVTGGLPGMARPVPGVACWPGDPWQGSPVQQGEPGGGSLRLGGVHGSRCTRGCTGIGQTGTGFR